MSVAPGSVAGRGAQFAANEFRKLYVLRRKSTRSGLYLGLEAMFATEIPKRSFSTRRRFVVIRSAFTYSNGLQDNKYDHGVLSER